MAADESVALHPVPCIAEKHTAVQDDNDDNAKEGEIESKSTKPQIFVLVVGGRLDHATNVTCGYNTVKHSCADKLLHKKASQ